MAEKFWEINLVQFWSQRMKPWQRDLVIILGLWMINPIFYGYRSPASLTPDAVSYLTLAQNIFSSGALVLKSWSHVDTNLILPPLLPAILALTNLVSTNAIQNGEWISAACMILSGVPIYLFVKHVSNVFFAAAAVVLFQTNLANIYFIPKHPTRSGEINLYTSATWLLHPQELQKYPHLVRLRYVQEENSSLDGDEQLLYEIM